MIGVVVILRNGATNISKSLVQVRTLLQAVQVLVLTKERYQKEMLMLVQAKKVQIGPPVSVAEEEMVVVIVLVM